MPVLARIMGDLVLNRSKIVHTTLFFSPLKKMLFVGSAPFEWVLVYFKKIFFHLEIF
jgi:hypothetical protein